MGSLTRWDQLALLKQDVKGWNKWRDENRGEKIDLVRADLAGAQLIGANLWAANLENANLSQANLWGADLNQANLLGGKLNQAILNRANLFDVFLFNADLSYADLTLVNLNKANLTGANLNGANLSNAHIEEADFLSADLKQSTLSGARLKGAKLVRTNLTGANLIGAYLSGADLNQADLSEADLSQADLFGANLTYTNLRGANILEANLSNATLVEANIEKAKISGSRVYGINVWNLKGEFDEQDNLVITPRDQPAITVDNVEVAQFVYLLINNKKIRNVIDTLTTKTILILGRFTENRKPTLDSLKDALRKRGFVPVLFDFQPSPNRDLTETVQLLANMAKFIIADITEAKSIPQELSHIIPFLPSVPVQPILLISDYEYGMFEHWRAFNSVLPEFLYQDDQDLIGNLEDKVMLPIDTWQKNRDKISILEKKIKELEAQLAQNS